MQFIINNIVVLIIVSIMLVIYRRMDSPSRMQSRIRRTADRVQGVIIALVDEKVEKLKNMAVEVEVQQQTIRAMLQKAKDAEESFGNRLHSVDRVENRIREYDQVLQDLALMTRNVEENMQRLHEESRYVDEVGQRVNGLREQVEHLQQNSESIAGNLHSENVLRLQELETKILADFDVRSTEIEERCNASEATIQNFENGLEEFRQNIIQLQNTSLTDAQKNFEELSSDVERDVTEAIQKHLDAELQSVQDIRKDFLELEEQTKNLFGRMTQEQENVVKKLLEVKTQLSKEFAQEMNQDLSNYNQKVKEQRDILAAYFSEFSQRSEQLHKKMQEWHQELTKKCSQEEAKMVELVSTNIEKQGKKLEKELEKHMQVLDAELGQKRDSIANNFDVFSITITERLEQCRVDLSEIQRAEQTVKEFMGGYHQNFAASVEEFKQSLVPMHHDLFEQSEASRLRLDTLKQEIQTFMDSLPALLEENHMSVEQRVYNNLDKRLSDFEQDLIYRITKLEVLRQDIDMLDKEMRKIIEQTTAELQSKFDDVPALIESEREKIFSEIDKHQESIRTDLAEITREVSSVKSRAHIDLSNKIELLSQDFLGNLSNKSGELEQEIEQFRGKFSEQMRQVEVEQYARLHEQEQELNKTIFSLLDNVRKQVQGQIQDIEGTVIHVRENTENTQAESEQKLKELEKEMYDKVMETRQSLQKHFEVQFSQHEGEVTQKLRNFSQETDASLQTVNEQVETIGSSITQRITELEQNVSNTRTMFQSQSTSLFEELEENKLAFREEIRGIINDARDQFFSQRHKLITKLEQNLRVLEDNLTKIDKRQREFIEQTKLFKRVETMRTELQENLNYYKEELEQLENARAVVRSLETEIEKIQSQGRENARQLLRLNEEKRRLDVLEQKYHSLSDVSQSVDRKIAEVSERSDELQELKARFQHIEILEKDLGQRLERLDKKRAIIDVTVKTVDSGFERLSELDSRIQEMSQSVETFATNVKDMGDTIQVLSNGKDEAEKVVETFTSLSGDLEGLEQRLQEVRESREWIARSETRFENLNREIDEQLKQLEHIVRGELKQQGVNRKASAAPSRDVQRTVLNLAQRGWKVEEIARVTKISKGEVELILEMSLRS